MVLKVEYASQCREMEALAVRSKQQLPVTGERQRMGFEYKCEICAGVQRPAENWGQSSRLLLCISFSVTDEQFSWPLFFLSANVFGINTYMWISTHIYMCVCMTEDNYFLAVRCKQANATDVWGLNCPKHFVRRFRAPVLAVSRAAAHEPEHSHLLEVEELQLSPSRARRQRAPEGRVAPNMLPDQACAQKLACSPPPLPPPKLILIGLIKCVLYLCRFWHNNIPRLPWLQKWFAATEMI